MQKIEGKCASKKIQLNTEPNPILGYKEKPYKEILIYYKDPPYYDN
jgi:hypothetical protein